MEIQVIDTIPEAEVESFFGHNYTVTKTKTDTVAHTIWYTLEPLDTPKLQKKKVKV